jgi:CrcB protein
MAHGFARDLVAVFVGGAVGTSARLVIDVAIPHDDSQFPTSTLTVNVVGSLVLGMLVARVWPAAPTWVRAGLGAGLLGSFTTFSALTVSLVALAAAEQWAIAAGYLLASLILGFAAAWIGLRLGLPAAPDLVDE